MARVVIPRATLKNQRACRNAYSSPEWNAELDALVYEDWDKTVERIVGEGNIHEIEWLVAHKLVPMTQEEFEQLKKKHGGNDHG